MVLLSDSNGTGGQHRRVPKVTHEAARFQLCDGVQQSPEVDLTQHKGSNTSHASRRRVNPLRSRLIRGKDMPEATVAPLIERVLIVGLRQTLIQCHFDGLSYSAKSLLFLGPVKNQFLVHRDAAGRPAGGNSLRPHWSEWFFPASLSSPVSALFCNRHVCIA